MIALNEGGGNADEQKRKRGEHKPGCECGMCKKLREHREGKATPPASATPAASQAATEKKMQAKLAKKKVAGSAAPLEESATASPAPSKGFWDSIAEFWGE